MPFQILELLFLIETKSFALSGLFTNIKKRFIVNVIFQSQLIILLLDGNEKYELAVRGVSDILQEKQYDIWD